MAVGETVQPCILVGEGAKKRDAASSLIELEVQEDHELASVFRVKLAIVREKDGLWTLLDDDTVAPWAKVEIKMHVGDRDEPMMIGHITSVRAHVDPQEGQSFLELAGMDTTGLMSLEEVIKDWPGKSDSAIASEIFTKYRLTADVKDTEIVHAKDDWTILQRESDIHFLKRLARRNGFECVVRGETGIFRPPDLSGKDPLPVLAAHFAQETNLNSFDVHWNLLRPAPAKAHQLDALTKQTDSVTAPASDEKALGTKDPAGYPPPPGRTRQAVLKHAVTTGRPELQRLAQAFANEAAWFLEGRGEVDTARYGAILHARRPVPVKGVGKLPSGVYYLTSVKHLYTVDRYTQQFCGRRNATTAKPDDFSGGGPGLPLGG